MIYRIIDKTTQIFLRDDVRFNPSTEIALPVDAPGFGLNSKWVGNTIMDNESNIGHWEDTRTQEDFALIEQAKLKATEIQNAINYLNETRYVCDNYSDCIYNEDKIRFLAEISDTYNISNSDILKKRREVREKLNKMQHEL